MDAVIRKRLCVHGRVQGVFFRGATERRARALGVAGWVRNRDDGSVEAVFEGAPARVERGRRVLPRGSARRARRSRRVHDEAPEGLRDFAVRQLGLRRRELGLDLAAQRGVERGRVGAARATQGGVEVPAGRDRVEQRAHPRTARARLDPRRGCGRFEIGDPRARTRRVRRSPARAVRAESTRPRRCDAAAARARNARRRARRARRAPPARRDLRSARTVDRRRCARRTRRG